ncbi:hypothetical protein ES705_48952 [subsurface metagenome]
MYGVSLIPGKKSRLPIHGIKTAILQVVGATQDSLQGERIDQEFTLVSVDLDDKNEGQLPMQFSSGDTTLTFRENYKTMAVIVVNTGTRDVQVAYSNDYSPPDFAALSVIKNALVDRYLDVYLTANEALYTDITEGPTIRYVTTANDTIGRFINWWFSSICILFICYESSRGGGFRNDRRSSQAIQRNKRPARIGYMNI